MRNITIFFVLLVFSFLIVNAHSQNLENQKVLAVPSGFKIPTIATSEKLSIQEGLSIHEFWEVYSDRKNNISYINHGLRTPKDTLEYLEDFYVIEHKGKSLHIVSDEEISFDGILSSKAIDKGWVSIEDLLLWNHCLVSDDNNVDIKVIFNRQVYNLNNEPSNQVSYTNDVFYLYKEENGYFLIGSEQFITSPEQLTIKDFGWIPNHKVRIWGNIVALEPNWDSIAVEQRKKYDLHCRVYNDKKAAKKNKKSYSDIEKTVWGEINPGKRYEGKKIRFPILEEESKICHVGMIGDYLLRDYYLDGFTNKMYKKELQSPFRKVVLLSKLELSEMINTIEKVSESISSPINREEIIQVWIDLLKNKNIYLKDSKYLSLKFSQIIETIYGIPIEEKEIFNDKKLKKIIKPKSITDKELFDYKEILEEKKGLLMKIFNSKDYKYSFKSLHQTYYWIPISSTL